MAQKKKRVKSDSKLIPVKDWDHADRMVKEVGEHHAAIESLQIKAQEEIDKIKEDLKDAVEPIQEEAKTLASSLKAFCVTHKRQFIQARSKKLNFGKVGFHKSTSIRIKKDTTLELIKSVYSRRRAKQYILVSESVSKDALARLTDEQLAEVGARRIVKDDFFVEPNKTEAADLSE